MLESYRQWVSGIDLPVILMLGIFIVAGRLLVLLFEKLRLPSIVGLLVAGAILGSSGLGLINNRDIEALSFLSHLALAFVALSLGLEFRATTIRSLGAGISVLIIFECFLTFSLITAGVWLVTGSLPFGLAAGAVGAASAPTGPLAIVSEFKARGPLTSAMLAITGFDDAISIVIFSFASTLAVSLYARNIGYVPEGGDGAETSLIHQLVLEPLLEIGLAVLIGVLLGYLYRLLTRKINDGHILFLWIMGMMFLAEGLSFVFHYSLILCNMIMGVVIINQISSAQAAKLLRALEFLMPIIFVLFFVFAGAQLDVRLIPSIGLAGLVYTVCRMVGKWLGATSGAGIAKLSPNIRKYSWAGLLSQVGVGLGLALVLIDKLRPLGSEAVAMGRQVLVIVTATSIIFEVIAPILTKRVLLRAGEIHLGPDGKLLVEEDSDDEDDD
ncbi:cation:proton antiporter [Candidatus Haliotispira prima]|uniref:Cation:proton antiporter n=1 Tax=Candidatus Haliotispira prima TaxID=3034016 RepID=A0ABY8MI21_9SPIO|nr:cation:proton antiporter [Candidatus Haliotispira prima]